MNKTGVNQYDTVIENNCQTARSAVNLMVAKKKISL